MASESDCAVFRLQLQVAAIAVRGTDFFEQTGYAPVSGQSSSDGRGTAGRVPHDQRIYGSQGPSGGPAMPSINPPRAALMPNCTDCTRCPRAKGFGQNLLTSTTALPRRKR